MKHFINGLLAILILSFSSVVLAEGFALVVNPANSVSGSEGELKQTIKRLYLSERTDWPDGNKARPIMPMEGSPEYSALFDSVLEMSTAEWATHWVRLKQQTGQTPPQNFNGRMALKVVERSEGGMAFLPLTEAEAAGGSVKILLRIGD